MRPRSQTVPSMIANNRTANLGSAATTNTAMPQAVEPSSASARNTRFSVIVPVYEHWHHIPQLLAHLAAQTLPSSCFEILLVDNGSSEFALPTDLPANACIHHCAEPGSYAARNHGIEQATGEWLVFTDADCRPCATWLESLWQQIERLNGTSALLAGPVEMACARECPGAYEMYDLVRGIPQAWYVSRGYAATANLAAPAVLAEGLGRFDPHRFSGGDAEFCRRASQAGVKLRYVPGAAVTHPARDSWAALSCKARRVKGGQLTAGSKPRRLRYWLRTFTPPLIAIGRFMKQHDQPVRYRLVATLVQFRIWGVEMCEALRLLGGTSVERR